MNLIEARQIGMHILSIDKKLFDKCKAAAEEMGVKAADMGPMCLALGIMGYAKAGKDNIEGELTDALALVAKAEREWRLRRDRRLQ